MTESIYWVEGSWPGKIAIIARPRGDEWLDHDVQVWRQLGLDVIVSLLTWNERDELGLAHEQESVEQSGLSYIAFPIPDRQTPSSLVATRTLAEDLARRLAEGQNIGVHCRQGIGRSALIVASVLILASIPVDTAFARITAARGCNVPDTAEQRQWVERLAALDVFAVL